MENSPADILLPIFEQLEDTLDAENLALCTKRLYNIFTRYRVTILTTVINNAETCREDLLLAYISKENEHVIDLIAHDTPTAELPDETAIYECYRKANGDLSKLGDDIIRRVCRQNRLAAALARQYAMVFGAFNLFQKARMVQDKKALHIAFRWYTHNITTPCRCALHPQFRSQFRRAVCAVSLGVASGIQGRFSNFSDEDQLHEMWTRAYNLSRLRSYEYVKCRPPSAREIRQCLEVWDFVYLFLLVRVAPPLVHKSLEAVKHWEHDISAAFNWEFYMADCRLDLTPSDVSELAAGQARDGFDNFPIDKAGYFKDHAMALSVEQNQGDWHSSFDRYAKLSDMRPDPTLNAMMPSEEVDDRNTASTWWDKERNVDGSPFVLARATPRHERSSGVP